tara:strand:+ start:465 stop:665 length:201 start_codon:yes stop_codon:yes gene_type:complete
MEDEINVEPRKPQQRKSLAVDEETYNKLSEICGMERRTKINTLRILIEGEHDRLFARVKERLRVSV